MSDPFNEGFLAVISVQKRVGDVALKKGKLASGP
jgi:hypothetical protein